MAHPLRPCSILLPDNYQAARCSAERFRPRHLPTQSIIARSADAKVAVPGSGQAASHRDELGGESVRLRLFVASRQQATETSSVGNFTSSTRLPFVLASIARCLTATNRFLTHLAVREHVAASTQNQALSALLFLYQYVLQQPLNRIEGVVRARRPKRLPVVLTVDEVSRLMSHLSGDKWLIAMLMYGLIVPHIFEWMLAMLAHLGMFFFGPCPIQHGDRFVRIPRGVVRASRRFADT